MGEDGNKFHYQLKEITKKSSSQIQSLKDTISPLFLSVKVERSLSENSKTSYIHGYKKENRTGSQVRLQKRVRLGSRADAWLDHQYFSETSVATEI